MGDGEGCTAVRSRGCKARPPGDRRRDAPFSFSTRCLLRAPATTTPAPSPRLLCAIVRGCTAQDRARVQQALEEGVLEEASEPEEAAEEEEASSEEEEEKAPPPPVKVRLEGATA